SGLLGLSARQRVAMIRIGEEDFDCPADYQRAGNQAREDGRVLPEEAAARHCSGHPRSEDLHSMISSARATRVGGTVSPGAFAVLRLTTSSYSAGLPRKGAAAPAKQVPGLAVKSGSCFRLMRSP